jgi:hypothetical protein
MGRKYPRLDDRLSTLKVDLDRAAARTEEPGQKKLLREAEHAVAKALSSRIEDGAKMNIISAGRGLLRACKHPPETKINGDVP